MFLKNYFHVLLITCLLNKCNACLKYLYTKHIKQKRCLPIGMHYSRFRIFHFDRILDAHSHYNFLNFFVFNMLYKQFLHKPGKYCLRAHLSGNLSFRCTI